MLFRSTLDAKLIPTQTQAPAALTGDREAFARPLLADELGMPPGLDIDGEPYVPHTPLPVPSQSDIQQAKFDATGEAIAKREADAAERDRQYQEWLISKRRG